MVNFSGGQVVGIQNQAFNTTLIRNGDVLSSTTSRIVIETPNNTVLSILGNFNYSGGLPSGTLTGYTLQTNTTPLRLIEQLSGASVQLNTVVGFIGSRNGAGLNRLFFAGNDTITGTRFRDSLSGFGGNDNIIGNSGNDRLIGGAGRDTLTGSTGNDILTGSAGNDTLIGGAGRDTLTGGAGNDRYLYDTDRAFRTANIGVDVITNFGEVAGNTDKIVLSETTFNAGTRFASVANNAAAATSGAFITYSRASGDLFYNQNGAAAGFGTGAQFATLTDIPSLAATDFLVLA